MTQPPNPGVTALRMGLVFGLANGAVSLANPILGATLFSSGEVFSPNIRTVQYSELAIGMLLCALAAFFIVRTRVLFLSGLVAALVASLVGAVLGVLINVVSAYVVVDAARNFLVAFGGDVSSTMPQSGVVGTDIAYGVVSLVFAVVTGVVAGIVGIVFGLFFREKAPVPAAV